MQISELVEVEHLSEVSGCALPPCLVISSHIKGKSSISIAKTGEGGSHPREKREHVNTTF